MPVGMLQETTTYSIVGLSIDFYWLANVWTQPYSVLVAKVRQHRLQLVGQRLDATVICSGWKLFCTFLMLVKELSGQAQS